MESIQVKAYAKINLGLNVLGRRQDGYHEVRMLMQTIRLFDKLTVKMSLIRPDGGYYSKKQPLLPALR